MVDYVDLEDPSRLALSASHLASKFDRGLISTIMAQRLGRATWIWKTEEVICNDGQIDQFAAFARRHGINRVYIHVNPDITHEALANFISKCNASGAGHMAVEALMGDPAWINDPQAHQSLQLRLDWIKDYQRRYAHTPVMLQGLHLDIEPWQLNEWHGPEKRSIIRKWTSCIQYFKSWANAQDPPLQVAADLPFWLHTIQHPDNGERLDTVMMSLLDGAVFMTYRNDPQTLMDIARDALAAGWSCGKRKEGVYLAVETVPSEEGKHISYHGLGGRRLWEDLCCLEGGQGLRKREPHEMWFGGLAVHDYHTWAQMKD